MVQMIKDVFRYWDLLWNLVARDLKIRYRGSILGFLWTILTPLFMALIYIFFLRLLAGCTAVALRSQSRLYAGIAGQYGGGRGFLVLAGLDHEPPGRGGAGRRHRFTGRGLAGQ